MGQPPKPQVAGWEPALPPYCLTIVREIRHCKKRGRILSPDADECNGLKQIICQDVLCVHNFAVCVRFEVVEDICDFDPNWLFSLPERVPEARTGFAA
jgi:hypothetical protein